MPAIAPADSFVDGEVGNTVDEPPEGGVSWGNVAVPFVPALLLELKVAAAVAAGRVPVASPI